MSDLTFNKVAGAVLATGLAIVGLRELSNGIFSTEKAEKPGYAIEVAAEAGPGGPAVEAPIDWGTVLPTADVAAGEAVFAKCKSCHTIDNGGANGTGPNQWGIVGRKPGAHAGFAYSAAMVEYGAKNPVWDFERLSEFIKNPAKDVPGTKMGFVGLKKPEDRINLLAYLHTKGATIPFPAPNPAAAAAPAAPAEGAAATAATPTATGSTATPPATAGGPAGQAPPAAPAAPAAK
ncbi:MAG: cytochrome c family protein [Pseudomonadota bacterium]